MRPNPLLLPVQPKQMDNYLAANFKHAAEIPGANSMLLIITLGGLLVLGLQESNKFVSSEIWPIGLTWLGLAMSLAGIVTNEFVLARMSPDGSIATSNNIYHTAIPSAVADNWASCTGAEE